MSKATPSNPVEAEQWLAGETRISRLPGGGIRVVAPAKINLTLWVGPCQADGFHQLDSTVATVSLVDRLSVYPASGSCELICTNPDLPCDQDNLVIRAVKALAEHAGREAHLRMHLEKNIPIGAGLGGGSSDAAASLIAINTLWKTGYNATQLADLAAKLGSDVPLFLAGPLARIKGRGELVEPLGFEWPFWAVLFCPPFQQSTAAVYRKFDELLTKATEEATIMDCKLGLHEPESAGEMMFNLLEPAARQVLPQLVTWRKALLAAGAKNVQLCGSGSALVCLFNSLAKARQLKDRLSPQLRAWVRIVHGGHR